MCGGQVFGEKPFCQGDETNKELQRHLASPWSSEDLLVSGCCLAPSQSHEDKSAGKYSNSGDSMEGHFGSSGMKRETLNLAQLGREGDRSHLSLVTISLLAN